MSYFTGQSDMEGWSDDQVGLSADGCYRPGGPVLLSLITQVMDAYDLLTLGVGWGSSMIWGRGSSISHKAYPSRRKTIREHGYKECRVGAVSRAVKVQRGDPEGTKPNPNRIRGCLDGWPDVRVYYSSRENQFVRENIPLANF